MHRLFLSFLLLFCFTPQLWAQNLENFLGKLQQKKEHDIQEKIYLHTDRANYTAGETIWIKAYTTIEIENHLSQLSKIGYIELIDPQNRVVADRKIALLAGMSASDILLADTLTEGTYRLRAYSNWMRNYDEDYFFEKLISVTNGRTDDVLTTSSILHEDNLPTYQISLKNINHVPLSKVNVRFEFVDKGKTVQRGSAKTDEEGTLRIRANEKTKAKDLVLRFENLNRREVSKVVHTNILEAQNSVQFFPEGGELLSGFLSKVGIKALRPNGKGIRATVDIIDTAGSVVASAETNHLGMGALMMLPETGMKYQARVRFEDGSQSTAPFLESTASGHAMMVNPNESSRILVQFSTSADRVSGDDVYLLAHHEGRVFLMSKQKHTKTEAVFRVERDQLPTGLITLTILDHDLRPLTERLVFNHHQEDFLPIDNAPLQAGLSTRQKVKVDLRVGDPADSLRLASLSAAVVNLSKLTDTADVQTNMLSSLLLEGDLKGFVESPGYYFRDPRQINVKDLDYLLITQGWRRFDWKSIDVVDTTKQFPAEQGLSIRGYVRKLGRKAPASGATVQLISANNFMDFIDTVASDDGYFEFAHLLFGDSTKFLLSAKDEKGRNNIDIEHIQDERPPVGQLMGGENDLNTAYNKEIENSKRFFDELEKRGLLPNVIEIEEVVVRRERTKVPEHSRNLNGPGNADQVITWEELENCPTLEMCLNGRLMGVMFRNGIPYTTRGGGEMQVVLDGMFVEGDMLNAIHPMDIASVEVLRNVNYTSIYGMHGGNGLIIITTKIGTERRANNFRPKGLLVIEPKGISEARQFYKPIYDAAQDSGFTNDLRTTIHWEPYIASDSEGKCTFDFYTSDEPGAYRITIEGIDVNGRLGRKIITFEVK